MSHSVVSDSRCYVKLYCSRSRSQWVLYPCVVWSRHALISWKILVVWILQVLQMLLYVSKKHSCSYQHQSCQKILGILESCQVHGDWQVFNNLISARNPNFTIGNKYLLLFSFQWQDFWKRVRQTRVWATTVGQSFFQVQIVHRGNQRLAAQTIA